MAKPDASGEMHRFIMLGSIGVVLTALYFGQEVLIPLALAALLSFLLAPLVKRLERLRLPRAVAVVVTVLFAFSVLSGIGWVVFHQLTDLKTSELPVLKTRVEEKLKTIRGPGGVLSSVKSAGAEVSQALDTATTQPIEGTPVRIVNQEQGNSSSPFDLLKPIGSFLLGPLGTAFIVTVFAIFMLLQREDLRDRLIRLVGRNRLTTTTQALDDAAARVSRYLMMQSIINGSVGACIFVLLWGVGRINGMPFPAAALWGLLAALMRFIPYIGLWISAVTPLALAFAVYPSAKVAVETLFVYGGVEMTAANAFEPLLLGSSTGIGTLAILVAAAFWTWLWGPVGLLLSTPLTVCLVVMGKYVPQLEFLTILLAEEPALSPPDRIYQRLLAMDEEEASELATEYLKTMQLEAIYETVLIPVLVMAGHDLGRGHLDENHHARIMRGVRDIVDELGDQSRAALAKTEDPAERVSLPKGCLVNVVCLPAHDESDEISGTMLGQLLELRGYCTQIASVTQLAGEMVETVRHSKADVVCISSLPPAAITHARYLCKRLQGKLPEIEMTVGLWNISGDLNRASERIGAVRSVQVASTFSQAIEQIHQMAQPKMMAVTGTGS